MLFDVDSRTCYVLRPQRFVDSPQKTMCAAQKYHFSALVVLLAIPMYRSLYYDSILKYQVLNISMIPTYFVSLSIKFSSAYDIRIPSISCVSVLVYFEQYSASKVQWVASIVERIHTHRPISRITLSSEWIATESI